MEHDLRDDEAPQEREPRSEVLRLELRDWLQQMAAAGKSPELFELEMWLRAFERFFRVRNQPLSEREVKQLALRNWSEELRLVDKVILRVVQLCTGILTEDQVNQTRFGKYVEGYLRKEDSVDPFVGKLLRQATPDSALTLLREALEDLHLVLADLVKLARIPYQSFSAVGRMLYREIRRSHLLALLIDRKFKPIHDRIANPAVAATIRGIPDPGVRRPAAKVFLELFRLLHYLEYANPQHLDDDALRGSILVFALVTSETRQLLAYIERRAMRGLPPDSPLAVLYDSFVYCLPFELKKVINTELLNISVTRQAESIRARVENSHGILRDSYQQSVVQLAQVFDPAVEGHLIFPDFSAKLEQSVALREALGVVIKAVRDFAVRKEAAAAEAMKEVISDFYDNQMKFLMYRDWSGFELFFIEILKCGSIPALLQICHRFETFLVTLYREVQKRSILREVPPAAEVSDLDRPRGR
jgi:hypothetical protein